MTTADFVLDCDLSELSDERFAVLKSLDISRQFRHWSLRNHPDKGADSEKFKDVSNLNEEISNIIRIEAEKRWTLDLSRKRASAKKKATERLLACVYRAVLSKQFQKYKFQVLPLPETAENIIHALDHRSEASFEAACLAFAHACSAAWEGPSKERISVFFQQAWEPVCTSFFTALSRLLQNLWQSCLPDEIRNSDYRDRILSGALDSSTLRRIYREIQGAVMRMGLKHKEARRQVLALEVQVQGLRTALRAAKEQSENLADDTAVAVMSADPRPSQSPLAVASQPPYVDEALRRSVRLAREAAASAEATATLSSDALEREACPAGSAGADLLTVLRCVGTPSIPLPDAALRRFEEQRAAAWRAQLALQDVISSRGLAPDGQGPQDPAVAAAAAERDRAWAAQAAAAEELLQKMGGDEGIVHLRARLAALKARRSIERSLAAEGGGVRPSQGGVGSAGGLAAHASWLAEQREAASSHAAALTAAVHATAASLRAYEAALSPNGPDVPAAASLSNALRDMDAAAARYDAWRSGLAAAHAASGAAAALREDAAAAAQGLELEENGLAEATAACNAALAAALDGPTPHLGLLENLRDVGNRIAAAEEAEGLAGDKLRPYERARRLGRPPPDDGEAAVRRELGVARRELQRIRADLQVTRAAGRTRRQDD